MKSRYFTRISFIYFWVGLCLVFLLPAPNFSQPTYFPTTDNWERRTPEQAKMDAVKLKEAIDFALQNESKATRNLELAHYKTFGREPFGEAVGAFKERGDGNYYQKRLYHRRMGRSAAC